ncbi:HAD family hydrolase [Luteolibacter sp. Populi]|uniref:HAD family hydrolase n=1 Tax=Luteolibacter sp. Populi TaxID=3230487 RepID=UPI0034678210
MSIRAVLFDIYGTLLVSNAGGTHPDPRLREAIAAEHARSPHPFPEVDIREIYGSLYPGLSSGEIETLVLEEEKASNPVKEMPGAAETLRGLAAAGPALGLVSNAQFYTAPLLEECLGASLEELGVDPELCRFSYLERRAKPDPFLFESLREVLATRGLAADEVLFVGNDVLKDIDPAKACGFKTALLVGDPGSLRLHGRSLHESGADRILSSLFELAGLQA